MSKNVCSFVHVHVQTGIWERHGSDGHGLLGMVWNGYGVWPVMPYIWEIDGQLLLIRKRRRKNWPILNTLSEFGRIQTTRELNRKLGGSGVAIVMLMAVVVVLFVAMWKSQNKKNNNFTVWWHAIYLYMTHYRIVNISRTYIVISLIPTQRNFIELWGVVRSWDLRLFKILSGLLSSLRLNALAKVRGIRTATSFLSELPNKTPIVQPKWKPIRHTIVSQISAIHPSIIAIQ